MLKKDIMPSRPRNKSQLSSEQDDFICQISFQKYFLKPETSSNEYRVAAPYRF